MNLHRVGKEADWATIAPENRNVFQRVAAKTGGILTPGNVVSVIGVGLVISGAKDITKGNAVKGIAKMGVGRLCDNADGWFAHRTGTKSTVGETVDVLGDKAVVGIVVPMVMKKNMLPAHVGTSLIAQNVANTIATLAAKKRGAEIHASAAGKYNTFGQSITVGMHLISHAARGVGANTAADHFRTAANVSFATTMMLGVESLRGYINDAMAPVVPDRSVESSVMAQTTSQQ